MNQRRVAIIDDEPDMTAVIADFLSSLGVQSEVFTEAEAALSAIGDGSGWRLVISDIRMPGMNGLQFLNRLKQSNVHLPVIFMSGHVDKAVKDRALENGASAVLFKPFDFKEIVDFVQNS
jgi:DNA-binding NtrC family response regulator